MYRYLAVVSDPHSVESARTLEALDLQRSKPPQWSLAFQGPGIVALHVSAQQGAASAYELQQRAGVVLGKLFPRERIDTSSTHQVKFEAAQARNIIRSRGRYLIEHYWGSYLAILYDEVANEHHVYADPLGTLPCFHLRHSGTDIFFSHLEDCLRLLPVALTVNRRYLTRWLFYSTAATDDVGLEGLSRLPRGECLTLSQGNISRSQVWDPAAIAASARFHRTDDAAHELRATVQNAVDAWASCYQRISLRLSGGLDSAIVAGCLARTPSAPEVTYLNLSVPAQLDQQRQYLPGIDAQTAERIRAIAGHGDERYFARLVAQRWNSPLIERRRDLSLDLARLRQAPLSVAPSMYFTMMEMDDAELELIASHGTQAFFSGQAGDSVFLATLQPLPAIDHAYLHGITRDLWRQLAPSAALSRESLWSVLGKTFRHGLLRRPYRGPVRLLERPTLLMQALARSLQQEELDSSFATLATRSSLPPGKRNHVQGAACAYHEFVFHAGNSADHIDPLNSQPVWELMLQIPTYTALTGGVSRGLARHAFADLLPAEIRRRQVKGTGTHFYQQVVRRNRSFLRERLADSLLVQEGYLDRRKLLDCLASEEPSLTLPAPTMLAYLAAEIWLQQWRCTDREVTAAWAAAPRSAAL